MTIKMIKELYDELNEYLDFQIEKLSLEKIKEKELELGLDFPESMIDFYHYYGNSFEVRNAFYLFDELENIRIENSALVFGDTDQRQMRLGITLEKLNSEYQSISQYLFDLKKWFSEGAMKPEGFFFNIAAWQILNLLPAMASVEMDRDDFLELCEKDFRFFSNEKTINLGYKIHACKRDNILACYYCEGGTLYLGSREDDTLNMLEDELGWELDWL